MYNACDWNTLLSDQCNTNQNITQIADYFVDVHIIAKRHVIAVDIVPIWYPSFTWIFIYLSFPFNYFINVVSCIRNHHDQVL